MTQRFLLTQLADIGDLVLTTPAIHALRTAHPEAHLTLLTTQHSAAILPDALVDEVITLDRRQFNSSSAFLRPKTLRLLRTLRKGGLYDAVVFFHHFTLKLGTIKFAMIAFASGARQRVGLQNGNSWFLNKTILDEGFGAQHQAQFWLDLVGLLGADTQPRPAVLHITPQIEAFSEQRPRIIIHPGSGGYSLARRWDAESFAAVADQLHAELGAQIILVGTKDDNTAAVHAAMRHTPLDLTGKTTLRDLPALLLTADVFIGADSGVMHLAAGAGVPVLAIFGPSNHRAWGPWSPDGRVHIVRSAPECSPCSYVGQKIGLREGCAARTCMRIVTPQEVIDAAKALLHDRTSKMTESIEREEPRSWQRITILGLPVDAISYDLWLAQIERWVIEKRENPNSQPRHVCTINPEFIMMAQRDVNFHNILTRAALCVPDGIGLVLAARWLGTPLPGRVTGSDGVPLIAAQAAKAGWKLFLLGAAPSIAEQAANVLRRQNPNLQIVGSYSGSPAPEDEDAIVAMINASGADLLFVAYGAPEQDKWIARNLPRLNVAMAMGVGGTLDFIAGVVPRAPLWMRQMGLEWLFRLILQPWRIKRMTRLPRFVLAIVLRGKN